MWRVPWRLGRSAVNQPTSSLSGDVSPQDLPVIRWHACNVIKRLHATPCLMSADSRHVCPSPGKKSYIRQGAAAIGVCRNFYEASRLTLKPCPNYIEPQNWFCCCCCCWCCCCYCCCRLHIKPFFLPDDISAPSVRPEYFILYRLCEKYNVRLILRRIPSPRDNEHCQTMVRVPAIKWFILASSSLWFRSPVGRKYNGWPNCATVPLSHHGSEIIWIVI